MRQSLTKLLDALDNDNFVVMEEIINDKKNRSKQWKRKYSHFFEEESKQNFQDDDDIELPPIDFDDEEILMIRSMIIKLAMIVRLKRIEKYIMNAVNDNKKINND